MKRRVLFLIPPFCSNNANTLVVVWVFVWCDQRSNKVGKKDYGAKNADIGPDIRWSWKDYGVVISNGVRVNRDADK